MNDTPIEGKCIVGWRRKTKNENYILAANTFLQWKKYFSNLQQFTRIMYYFIVVFTPFEDRERSALLPS